MDGAYLLSLVAAQAPIDGISFGKTTDKTTWRIDFRPEANPAQQSAARTVLDGYDPTTPTTAEIDFAKQARIDALDLAQLQIAFNHENRIRALEGKQPVSVAQFKTAVKALL